MGNVNANGNLFIYFYSPQFSSCSLPVCPAVLFLQLANENSTREGGIFATFPTTHGQACQSHFVFNLRRKVCHDLLQAEVRLSDSRLCVCVLCAWHVRAYQLISICK